MVSHTNKLSIGEIHKTKYHSLKHNYPFSLNDFKPGCIVLTRSGGLPLADPIIINPIQITLGANLKIPTLEQRNLKQYLWKRVSLKTIETIIYISKQFSFYLLIF